MSNAVLPIDAVLPEVVVALRNGSAVVIQAPAGAGKTTRVPPALLQAGLAGERQIVVLQPRRLAARAAAARMARELGWRLGQQVGYQVRFEQRIGPTTRIAVVTEGVLLRRLREDPFLQDVAVAVFDEFHERNLNSELALGMIRQVQQSVRPDLRIVVMSATLAAEPIARYWDSCPIVQCAGRTFPVEIAYSSPPQRLALSELAAAGVQQVLDQSVGDVLVFLPGLREIRQAKRHLEGFLLGRDDVALLELHGDLPLEQQDAVLARSAQRKVILSTNVAETSLTIEGVTAVVDSGWARQLRFEPAVGLDRLELTPISHAAAEQRAGRAGRTQPGLCLRLWDERSHASRPAFEEAEIRRVDLAGAVLQVLGWIEPDLARFPWFEPPRDEVVQQALRLLRRLEAADEAGVTENGRRIAELPVHPRLGRLLLEAQRRDCLEPAAWAAALLSEGDPFRTSPTAGSRPRAAAYHVTCDLGERVAALQALYAGQVGEGPWGGISRSSIQHLARVRRQLVREVRGGQEAVRDSPERASENTEEALRHCLLAAFPDRLARRRELGSRRGVMVGGRGVRLAEESQVGEGDFFLCVDVDGAGTDAWVRKASVVERHWLVPPHVDERVELFFDAAAERVSARRRVYWEDLQLEETMAPLPDAKRVARVLAAAAVEHWDRVFPAADPVVANFLGRVRSLARWMPELNLPPLEDASVQAVLPSLCLGRRTFAELRTAPWLAALQNLLSREQLLAVDHWAPERLLVPSGRSVQLRYEAGKPPILAVRIQEMFGLVETPRIARGHVPVLLHLLAPNQRVQQITDDLRSFWDNTYPRVRKDLRGRYPKHAWPEDPRTARPERK
jgi:ATP-dependent helicase HrpB